MFSISQVPQQKTSYQCLDQQVAASHVSAHLMDLSESGSLDLAAVQQCNKYLPTQTIKSNILTIFHLQLLT